VVEITPSFEDENCYINTAIDAGSENRLNNKNISALPRSFAMAKHSKKKG
jgi:hypothetical protein